MRNGSKYATRKILNPQACGRKAGSSGISAVGVGSEYDADELELIQAIDRYRITHRKRFVSCVEVLAVAKSLGYRRMDLQDRDETAADKLTRMLKEQHANASSY